MKEETKRWIAQAEEDFASAQATLRIGQLKVASFLCQQTVEKALKALLIDMTGTFPKIHDLVRLGRLASLEASLLKECERLTFVYVESRYPDTSNRKYTTKETTADLASAKKMLTWVQKKLS